MLKREVYKGKNRKPTESGDIKQLKNFVKKQFDVLNKKRLKIPITLYHL